MTHQPFFVPAVVIFLLSIPLIAGIIPRQWGYGIRTRKTLSDDSIWYSANRMGGWAFLLSSLVYLVVAKVIPNTTTVTTTGFLVWLLHFLAFAGPIFISLIFIRYYIENL
jgi:uncharacterized membrane protein